MLASSQTICMISAQQSLTLYTDGLVSDDNRLWNRQQVIPLHRPNWDLLPKRENDIVIIYSQNMQDIHIQGKDKGRKMTSIPLRRYVFRISLSIHKASGKVLLLRQPSFSRCTSENITNFLSPLSTFDSKKLHRYLTSQTYPLWFSSLT